MIAPSYPALFVAWGAAVAALRATRTDDEYEAAARDLDHAFDEWSEYADDHELCLQCAGHSAYHAYCEGCRV